MLLSNILQVKKESAQSEKAWHGSGQKVGVQIWRIVKFKASLIFFFLLNFINYEMIFAMAG